MTWAKWLCCGVAISAAVSWSAWALADGKYEKYEDQMERVHSGRRSPFRTVDKLLAADSPAFADIAKSLPPLQSMAKALKESKHKDIRDSADGYYDAVTELTAAVGKKNRDGARGAFKKLTESCGDCHSKGGVGGELDD